MINGKRVAVVMPAYNAERTLEQTVRELSNVVDIKILVDDSSKDKTAELSRKLGVQTFIHDANYGYGRNQQTCYREALAAGADVVVMVHPDYLEPAADGVSKSLCGREAVGISHRVPRFFARTAASAATAREFRRFRLRQPDDCAGGDVRLQDRRDFVPDEVLRGGFVDQLQAQCEVRIGRPGDNDRFCCAQDGNSSRGAL